MEDKKFINLKISRPVQNNITVEEAENPVKSELNRAEQKKKTQRAAAFLAEKNEKKEENNALSPEIIVSEKTLWLKLGRLFLYFLIFFLPLFFLPATIYPVDANKQFFAAFLVLASLFCYLANSYFTRKIVYFRSMMIIAAIVFVTAGGLSAFFSVSPAGSIYGDFNQVDVFINFITYALALYLAAVFFKKEDFNKIGTVFAASLGAISILGLLQLFGVYIFPFDFAKQSGFNVFGSAVNFDIFIAFGFVLIVAALAELNISRMAKAGLILVGLLTASNLVLINYQPVWILLAIIMVVYAIYKFTFKPEDTAVFSIGSGTPLIIGIVAFLFALASPSLPKVFNMPNLPVDVKPNFSATMNIAKDALGGLRVLTGTGLATFSSEYNIYRPVELNQTDFWLIKFNQGFSFFATYLTTAGIIGILSIVFLVFVFARLAVKNIEDKKVFILSIGMLFMVLGWFYFPASFVIFIFSFIVLGMLAGLDSEPETLDFSRAAKGRVVLGFIAIIILAAGAISMFYITGKKYAAAFYFQNGLTKYDSTNTVKSSENILRAVLLDAENDQYLRSASQLLMIDAQNSRDANIELTKDTNFQSKIADAVGYAKRATEVNPSDSENWYNLGDIYEKIISIASGADSFAENSYRKASELNPKNPNPLIGQAKVLMFTARQAKDDNIKQQKMAGAINALEKAAKLKADYAAAHYQLGIAYMQAERKDDAIKELELAKDLSDFDAPVNFQLGMLHYNNNDFDKAKSEMENAISQDPNFSNARYVLGLIYDKKGQKDDAIGEFEKVLKLNPGSTEVKNILSNLNTKGSAFASDKPVSSEDIDQSLGLPFSDQNQDINAGVGGIQTGENPIVSPSPSAVLSPKSSPSVKPSPKPMPYE